MGGGDVVVWEGPRHVLVHFALVLVIVNIEEIWQQQMIKPCKKTYISAFSICLLLEEEETNADPAKCGATGPIVTETSTTGLGQPVSTLCGLLC